MNKVKNLNQAHKRISELEAQLAGNTAGSLPTLKKPGKLTVADAKTLIASNPGALASLESIQNEIDSIGTPEARIKSLAAHSQSYLDQAAKARQAKDYAAETNYLRARQRLEVRRAYELHNADPATQKAFFRQIPNI